MVGGFFKSVSEAVYRLYCRGVMETVPKLLDSCFDGIVEDVTIDSPYALDKHFLAHNVPLV